MGSPADVARAMREQAGWCEQRAGMATVVFHSIVAIYLTPEARARMTKILTAAGEQAASKAPLAWLSMEPNGREDDVFLTIWSGGARMAIATAGYHGGRAVLLSAASDSHGAAS